MRSVNYEKIMVTHDGSRIASVAVPHAAALAKACKAELIILRVVVPITPVATEITPHGPVMMNPDLVDNLVKKETKRAQKHLEKIKEQLEKDGITRITTIVVEGSASGEIIHQIKKTSSDLVVLATHGWSGLTRVLLGSIADDIVRKSPCPTLLIRPKNK